MPKRIEYKEGEQVGACIYLRDTPIPGKKRRCLFKCMRCGNLFETQIAAVKLWNTKSCGCLNFDTDKRFGKNTTHCLTNHSLYIKWIAIKQRCYNVNNVAYKNYGGRGIIVCDEWRNDFKAFYDYVTQLSHYGEAGMTLDRTNNDGIYEPGNVRWATRHIQSTNRRYLNPDRYVGVYKSGKKWQSMISVNNTHHYLGTFDSNRNAVNARNEFIIANNLTEYKIQ